MEALSLPPGSPIANPSPDISISVAKGLAFPGEQSDPCDDRAERGIEEKTG
jgi:hypothetical protein